MSNENQIQTSSKASENVKQEDRFMLKTLKKQMSDLFGEDVSYSSRYRLFTYKSGYFYRSGRNSDSTVQELVLAVADKYPNLQVNVQSQGDHWASFGRFFWVKFSLSSKSSE